MVLEFEKIFLEILDKNVNICNNKEDEIHFVLMAECKSEFEKAG
jgi:hypothetical protein